MGRGLGSTTSWPAPPSRSTGRSACWPPSDPADVVPVLAEVERATAQGCWAFGYVAYEAAAGLDPRLAVRARRPDDGLPLVLFALCERPGRGSSRRGRRRDGPAATGWGRGSAAGPSRATATTSPACGSTSRPGDTYQLNLTVRMRAEVAGDLEQLYADLAWAQRGSYAAYLDLGRYVVASASPELFFDWTADRAADPADEGHRPPRGARPPRTPSGARGLVGSEKERAENLMIVDLLRNDLGRIAEVGQRARCPPCSPPSATRRSGS